MERYDASQMVLALIALLQPALPIRILDAFGRDVTKRGVTLVEWGGPIANPAIQLSLSLPPGLPTPCDVYVHGDNQLIQFDKAGRDDRYGVGRRIHLDSSSGSTAFHVSIFPSHGKPPAGANLLFQIFDSSRTERARLSVPVSIVDLTRPSDMPRYPILLDFSEDKTGFFQSADARRVVQEAADDWSYFLDDLGESPTPAGTETSQQWRQGGYIQDYKVQNAKPYRGYLMYMAGIDVPEWRSGGAPSPYGGFQSVGGRPLGLRRSGTVEVETAGNYNRMGWVFTRSDDDWWVSGNQRIEPSDLYTTMLHEMGHALGFHPDYPVFGAAKRSGELSSPALLAYVGHPARIDPTDHFPGLIDPVSGYGGFGNEYEGWMKTRRWLITKASLLCLQAIGYKIRHTAAFDALTVSSGYALRWTVGRSVSQRISVSGGIPTYDFEVVDGALPPGVSLDSFTGVFSGMPASAGEFRVQVRVRDNDPTTQPRIVDLKVEVIAGGVES